MGKEPPDSGDASGLGSALKSKTKPKPGVRLRRMWPAAIKDEKGPTDHSLIAVFPLSVKTMSSLAIQTANSQAETDPRGKAKLQFRVEIEHSLMAFREAITAAQQNGKAMEIRRFIPPVPMGTRDARDEEQT